MTDITGIYALHPEDCPHAGFGLQSHLFDDDLTCDGCGEVIEISDSDSNSNLNGNTTKEIN